MPEKQDLSFWAFLRAGLRAIKQARKIHLPLAVCGLINCILWAALVSTAAWSLLPSPLNAIIAMPSFTLGFLHFFYMIWLEEKEDC